MFCGRIIVIVAEMEPGTVTLVDGNADTSAGANDGTTENEDRLFDSMTVEFSIRLLTAEAGVDHPMVVTIGSKKTKRRNISGHVTPKGYIFPT